MVLRIQLALVSFALAALLGISPGRAQEKKPQDAPPLDPAAVEKAMADYARVTDKHKGFQRLVGKWNTDMKVNKEDGTVEESKGQATFRLLMGGRFLQQNFQGQYEDKPFRGMGLTGYDNAQKKYVGVWIDNMGTGIMHTTGKYDEKTHVMTEMGESETPLGKMKMKMVTRAVDENKFTFTMYMLGPDGGEQKMMEIVYTRAANAASEKADK